ncbi:class I SAM-dependent methyltransferase [Patescibacteria group bacterium]|nr:class I SAM-dependent methyltransferase [Patescibacteria group bacterium]
MVEYKWLSPKIKRTQAIVKPMLRMLEREGKNLRVLDAGCGDGTVSEVIVRSGYQVWGIDTNPEVLKEAQKRGVKIFEGELEKELPFENESFDAVWCLRVLEHIYHTEHFLKECHRVLKQKGELIVTAQNMTSLTNRIRILFGAYPLWVAPSENYPYKNHSRFADHMRCFTKSTLEEVLKKAGFKVERITADFICFNPGQYNSPPWSGFLGKICPSLGKICPSLGETLIAKARKI